MTEAPTLELTGDTRLEKVYKYVESGGNLKVELREVYRAMINGDLTSVHECFLDGANVTSTDDDGGVSAVPSESTAEDAALVVEHGGRKVAYVLGGEKRKINKKYGMVVGRMGEPSGDKDISKIRSAMGAVNLHNAKSLEACNILLAERSDGIMVVLQGESNALQFKPVSQRPFDLKDADTPGEEAD